MPLLALPAFNDNYIWALQASDGTALVVDPGQARPVLEAAEAGLRPVAILLTHHHADHVGGVAELLERWPGLPVHAPHDPRIAFATHRVGHGDRVVAGDWTLEVIAVPGHTLSHVAFHLADGQPPLLFCGDTLFSLGCGRMFEGDAPQMLASLDRLAALPGGTRVCCGHEYTLSNAAFARVVDPDNPALLRRLKEAQSMRAARLPTLPALLSDECAANPFLRTRAPAIVEAVRGRLGRAPGSAADVFAELRRWKDGFVA
ncbi:hydroxyacylglutathione hydrolase [Lysobacter sp. A3-1-A15]|uniref:hydroxyacylglutathione hydrolase n=1 Tax=Novilysobacter viscosus TaxID=3098602 RepID=UPI002ED79CED